MKGPLALNNPRTVEEVFRDFKGRHTAIVKALTTDVDKFYFLCDPEKDNLCLFGYPNERWEVTSPVQDVPPELPEPAIGINFSRDGMKETDWLSLVAIHSDAWLISVAYYFGSRFDFNSTDRYRLFTMINELPTISETVIGTIRKKTKAKPSVSTTNNSKSKSGLEGGGSPSGKSPKKSKDEDEDANANADADKGLDGKFEEDGESLCGACGERYADNEFWICCDKCDKWFHGKCVKVTEARANHIKQYKCPPCSSKRARHNSS